MGNFSKKKVFSPWITCETKELIAQRDIWKDKCEQLSALSPDSADHQVACSTYETYRNKINNRKKYEENDYKKEKIAIDLSDPAKMWRTTKQFMNWKSVGTPSQLEVDNKLVTSAIKIADIMNNFFIDKVKDIK